eukprot:5218848-Amphidinium_carterae.1
MVQAAIPGKGEGHQDRGQGSLLVSQEDLAGKGEKLRVVSVDRVSCCVLQRSFSCAGPSFCGGG